MTKTKKPAVPADSPAKLQAQIEELTQALQRERADAVNLRRRHEAEITDLRTRLKATVVADLLPVIDNFERAREHNPWPDADKLSGEGDKKIEWARGINKILEQFEKTLADMGVERIKTVGQPFDPRYHEAVSAEEGEGGQEIVSEELQAGYKIGGDVIRPAMVRIKLER